MGLNNLYRKQDNTGFHLKYLYITFNFEPHLAHYELQSVNILKKIQATSLIPGALEFLLQCYY